MHVVDFKLVERRWRVYGFLREQRAVYEAQVERYARRQRERGASDGDALFPLQDLREWTVAPLTQTA